MTEERDKDGDENIIDENIIDENIIDEVLMGVLDKVETEEKDSDEDAYSRAKEVLTDFSAQQ